MKPVLLAGTAAGLALGLFFLLVNSLGLAYAAREIAGLAAMAVALVIAQVVVVRAQDTDHMVPFPARYFTALFAGVVAAVVYGGFSWVYFAIANKEYLARFYTDYLERARAEAATPAEGDQLVAAVEGMRGFITDPLSQALVQFGTVMAISLLTAVLVSLLTQPGKRAA